ncbi:MAG: putative amidohydrolase YtcJ [Candidatus Azotimanducaceae bacterium]|jgi:predicted amidohydrolase YtcJ|tara:strand:- start:5733 stop:7481 length:1749 start_codon:yes stop_codon:yes gene_type:complete
MRNYTLAVLITAVFAISGAVFGAEPSQALANEPAKRDLMDADVAFYGDNILTFAEQPSTVNFVAIKGEKIVFVGLRKNWRGNVERIVALKDKALLPGFIDAHGHISFHARVASLANVASPPVGPAKDIAGVVQELKNYADSKKLAKGQWIIGMGYDDSLLTEQRHPTRDDLDLVSNTHPIMLMHVSGHLAAVNSKALEITNINAASKDPAGGVIRRYVGTTKPNGVLEESATYAVRKYMAASNKPFEEIHRGVLDYARYGITTAQDGAASIQGVQLLQASAAYRKFPIDVVAYQIANERYLNEADLALPVLAPYENGFRVGGVKMVLDGSPQGKTAYLTKPYEVQPHGQSADYRGYPIMPAASVDALFNKFISADIPFLAHANGDAAADLFIQALAKSLEGKKPKDHRSVMIHAQTVRDDQLDSMAAMNVIPSYFSAHTFYWGDWHRDSVLGLERGSRISPTASSLAKGITFTVHNDAPIVPPDVMRLVWATSNRLTRSGQVLGPDERISVEDALKAVTVNAAYQYFEEDRKGSIEVGKQADFVLLSANPLNIQREDLLNIKVLQTIARGVTVFSAENALPE